MNKVSVRLLVLGLFISFSSLAWPQDNGFYQPAIDFVKQYKAKGKTDTLLDSMAKLFSKLSSLGTNVKIDGWVTYFYHEGEYYVYLKFTECERKSDFKFLVDLNTEKIVGCNKITKYLIKINKDN